MELIRRHIILKLIIYLKNVKLLLYNFTDDKDSNLNQKSLMKDKEEVGVGAFKTLL